MNIHFAPADTFWLLFTSALIFFMQPGFAMLEAGLTRAKNAGNIVMKNLMDFALGTLAFWAVGFGLMFGSDIDGLIGMPDLFSQHLTVGSGATYPILAFVLFQTVCCVIAATIVSGAMAERSKFSAYCIASVLISLFVYPIVGHWIWGGGWLAAMGFHDFAGAVLVNLTGGVCAFAGARLIGPRIGKYRHDGSVNAIPGHSLPLACLGLFILWFGWFGFNGGSTLSLNSDAAQGSAALIFMTTNLAAAAGTVAAMLTTWLRYGKPDVSLTLNGALAALVAISAGCDAVSVPGSFFIGALAGILTVFAIEFIDQKLKVDDPVGAIATHGFGGALGTILTGLFSVKEGLFYTGDFHFLGVQILGTLVVAVFVFVVMTLIFRILDGTLGLRVSAAEEINGLDFKENGLAPAWSDLEEDDGQALADALKAGEAPQGAKEVPLSGPVPDSVMAAPQPVSGHALYNVTIITDEKRFETLKDAMEAIGITGMTITRALGFGIEKGRTEFYRGAKISAKLLPKVRVEMVVSKVSPRLIIETAKKVLYTGNYGDGKVFVSTIDNAVKIRTGEEGYDALQDYPVAAKK
nr:ammonium transporter [uncultured Megasphaera sp.]